jgi:hypothetical protein
MQELRRFSAFIILGSVLLVATRCGPQPEPMSQSTPIPSGLEVVNISEENTVTNEITQYKTFNQCDSASPFKAQIQFSQSGSQEAQQELVLGAGAGGEVGISEIAKVAIEGKVEQHFRGSTIKQQGHEESVAIEVPPRTQQEYTIVWRESRREGTVQYTENGESKTASYSYRIGLELASATGRDLPCPGQEASKTAAMLTYTPYPTYTPLPTHTPFPTSPSPTFRPTPTSPTPTLHIVAVTATPEPTPTVPENTPPGSVLAVGETWQQNGLQLTLDRVNLDQRWTGQGYVNLYFVMHNGTNQTMIFEFDTRNLTISDSNGSRYERDDVYICTLSFELEPGETKDTKFGCPMYPNPSFEGNYFDASVQYLQVTVRNFGRIGEAQWRIGISH